MGNITYNSFRKNISNEEFAKELIQITETRFNNKVAVDLDVVDGKICSWTIRPNEYSGEDRYLYEITFYRESKRKFSARLSHSDWGNWLLAVMQNELAKRNDGLITSEGVQGSWKGNTNKHPTFRSWMEKMYRNMYKKYPMEFEYIFNMTPERLKKM